MKKSKEKIFTVFELKLKQSLIEFRFETMAGKRVAIKVNELTWEQIGFNKRLINIRKIVILPKCAGIR